MNNKGKMLNKQRGDRTCHCCDHRPPHPREKEKREWKEEAQEEVNRASSYNG